jgi:outer membrane receptor protein involved in Fe transport
MDLARRREDLFQLLYPELSGEDIDFGQEVFRNIGFYGQLLWNPYRWMGVTAGVRGDINNMSPCNAEDSSCLGVREDEVLELSRLDRRLDDMELTDRGLVQMSSRLGVVLKPGVWNGYVKLLYGSSFKPPSSYQLYHRPWALEGATAGNPALYPQTADTVELIVGAEVLEGVNVRLNAYRTEATDIVISVREGADVENRNADMESTGLEFELKGEISSQLSFFLNGSYLLDATVTPKRDKGESEAAWAAQPGINRTVAAGKFPGVVLNGGMECRFSEQVLGFVGFNHVGTRSASLVNNTLYNSSLSSTYRFEPYTLVDVNLLVKGMEMVEFRDTSVGLSLRYPLTDYSQPGEGGIDLPSLGPQLYLNLRQEL